MKVELNVLLVEDDPADMAQFLRDFPPVFERQHLSVKFDNRIDFESAYEAIANPHVRYDLVISDTYRGNHVNRDAAVLRMVDAYRKGRFAPLIVCSSASKPEILKSSAFVMWADKSVPGEIESAIESTLKIGVPQIARALHDEIDRTAGNYLWKFLEDNWENLGGSSGLTKDQIERIIRRRAALKISDLIPGSDAYAAISKRHGLEYYIYPALDQNYFNLGDVIRHKETKALRVVLTPHCYLAIDRSRVKPKAEFVLTTKAVGASVVIGPDRIANTRAAGVDIQDKKLSAWSRNSVDTKPEGRHWYLPKFLDIPHSFCDFLQVESIAHQELWDSNDRLATLTPPYAEALQESFSSFYGSVGVPEVDPGSIRDLLNP